MKVVLFCGGYGMRMRDGITDLSKPMALVGPRPLLWHVMRYYAYFGHTDAPLDDMIARFAASNASASLLAVPPQAAFHCVQLGEQSMVEEIISVNTMQLWENGGYFVLRQQVFDHLPENGDLEHQPEPTPFQALVAKTRAP